MPKRIRDPDEDILEIWANKMINSASKASSSKNDRERAASVSSISNESPCAPPSAKKARTTPNQDANKGTLKSPPRAPVASQSNRRESSIAQNPEGLIDLTDETKEDLEGKSDVDDSSVVEIVDGEPSSSGSPIPKEINKRKAPAFRRAVYAQASQPSPSSIQSVDDDADASSEQSEDSSVQLVGEIRPVVLPVLETDPGYDSSVVMMEGPTNEATRNNDRAGHDNTNRRTESNDIPRNIFARRHSLSSDEESRTTIDDSFVEFVKQRKIGETNEPIVRRDSVSVIEIDDHSDSTEDSSVMLVEGASMKDDFDSAEDDTEDSSEQHRKRPSYRTGAMVRHSPDDDLLVRGPKIGNALFVCTPSASDSAPTSSDDASLKQHSNASVAMNKKGVAPVPEKRNKKSKRSGKRCRSLARKPTWDFRANHPNPDGFSSNTPGHSPEAPILALAQKRPSISAIRAMARCPASNIEIGGAELTKYEGQTYSFVDSSELIIIPPRFRTSRRVQCPLIQFDYMFEKGMKVEYDKDTEEIEDGELVRAANRRLDRELSYDQISAQYGRMLPEATQIIFRLLRLKRGDLYFDIGAGLCNSVLQAAFTVGCESRGIEIVTERYDIGVRVKKNLKNQLKAIIAANGGRRIWKKVGKATLLCGRLEDPKNFDFITNCSGTKPVKAFANNFNGVFADRSAAGNQIFYLDDYIAGLFAEMKPGSILVTLHKLKLPLSHKEATELLKRQNSEWDEDVSFYKMTETVIGKANECVSWSVGGGNKHDITVYCYERLQQKSEKAVFLCCNKDCRDEKRGPISATKKYSASNPDGIEEERTVINFSCSFCSMGPMSLRHRGSEKVECSDSK